MREHFETPQAIVLVGGRAFVAYPYRDAEPVPEGVAVLHVADNPEAFGREHAADMALLGDIGATLAAAAQRLAELGRPQGGRGPARGARRRKRAAQEALRAEILAETGQPLSPDAAVLAALDALPRGRADRQRFRRDLRPGAGPADDPARPLLLRPRRRARLQHAGGRRRVARGARLRRLVRRRRRGDVFAAGAVERGALPGARSSSSCSTTAAMGCCRTSPAASATPTPSPAASSAWRSSVRRSTFRRSRRSMGVPAARADDREAIAAAVADALARNGPALIEISRNAVEPT